MASDFQNRMRRHLEPPAPAEHPAADLLNAYVEGVLSSFEERQVVEHLSICADCREVVYLAASAVDKPSKVSSEPTASHRIRWWTWAVPVAAVLVVASTVVVLEPNLMRSRSATQQLAQSKPEKKLSPPPAASPVPPPAPAAPVAEEAPKRKDSRTVVEKQALREPENNAVAKNVPQVPPESRDKLDLKTDRPNSVNGTVPAATRQETTSVEVTAQDALVEPQPSNETPAKAAAPGVTAGALQRTYSSSNMTAKKAQAPSWGVTPEGKLQHSVQGRWKIIADLPGRFLAVASVGDEVWAGGTGLALYHSADNGLTWQKQIVPGMAGDIVHLEFVSSTLGVLRTSAGAAFSTHDGGKTWDPAD